LRCFNCYLARCPPEQGASGNVARLPRKKSGPAAKEINSVLAVGGELACEVCEFDCLLRSPQLEIGWWKIGG
jgi:hypothetical protein